MTTGANDEKFQGLCIGDVATSLLAKTWGKEGKIVGICPGDKDKPFQLKISDDEVVKHTRDEMKAGYANGKAESEQDKDKKE